MHLTPVTTTRPSEPCQRHNPPDRAYTVDTKLDGDASIPLLKVHYIVIAVTQPTCCFTLLGRFGDSLAQWLVHGSVRCLQPTLLVEEFRSGDGSGLQWTRYNHDEVARVNLDHSTF